MFPRRSKIEFYCNYQLNHNKLKIPNWRNEDQLAIHQHDREVEVGFNSSNNSSFVVRFELATSGFQI